MRDFPLRAWLYTATVALGAATLVRLLADRHGVDHVAATIGFGFLFLLAELRPITIPQASGAPISYSVSFVIVSAAMIALGPTQAAIVASFGALDPQLRTRPDWFGRLVFNGSQLTLATALAGMTYVACHGPVGSISGADFPFVLLPLLATSLVYFIANTSAVAGMVSLVRRTSFREVWWSNFFSVTVATFAFGVLGILFAVVYEPAGLPGAFFMLVPLLVARKAFQAATDMNEAYEATLRGLVTAIEAKDAYTRGHAERVSILSARIARELGLNARRVRALRIAALLHDVGKLVVSTAVLTKPGKLSEEEYEHMKSHPLHGVDIVDEIDFLRDGEAILAVRHHHERMDGRGYPDGIGGEELPLTARVVMVADAFDAMTSTRSYRFAKQVEPAVAELRRCEGTQFDPKVIDALERAIARHGWEPSPEAFEGEKTERPATSVHAQHA